MNIHRITAPHILARYAGPLFALAFGFAAGTGLGLVQIRSSNLSCPASARPMARLELLFGRSRRGGAEVSEQEWSTFLDSEVTPRFPDGLTVLSGVGQWRGSSGSITREQSIMLVIWHEPGPAPDADIESIRAAYKLRFGQESVMRVDSRSCVSF